MSDHIEAAVLATLRSLSPARRLILAREMNRMADRLALAGIRRRRPGASPREWGLALALQRLQPEQQPDTAGLLAGLPLQPAPADPLALALRVGAILDAQGIPSVIVGSLAAVAHGEQRVTRDLDLLIDPAAQALPALVAALSEGCTLPPDAPARLARQLPYHAFDTATGFPLDVYLAAGRPFDMARLQRGQAVDIPGEPSGTLRVASPEDTVLATLAWYGEARSEQHWRDVRAILRVQGDALDLAYLSQWADRLGLGLLLEWVKAGV